MKDAGQRGGSPFGAPSGPPAWRPQFGLWTLLGVMFLFAILFAVWRGLLQAGADRRGIPFFVVLSVAAPMLTMIALSLMAPLMRLWRRFRGPTDETKG